LLVEPELLDREPELDRVDPILLPLEDPDRLTFPVILVPLLLVRLPMTLVLLLLLLLPLERLEIDFLSVYRIFRPDIPALLGSLS
jgi:hypothetical protein